MIEKKNKKMKVAVAAHVIYICETKEEEKKKRRRVRH
jgi:hypothetical protein